MGLIVQTTCRECGASVHEIDGPVMAGYRPRCEDCGDTRLVPWQDVPDRRHELVTELTGACECGGRFTTDAPLRCPACRSTDLDVEHVGIAD